MTSKSEPFPHIFAFLAYETACRSENIERLLEQQNIFIKDLSIQDLSVTKSFFFVQSSTLYFQLFQKGGKCKFLTEFDEITKIRQF